MEILSTMTTRTDSGSGVKQRSGSGLEENGSRFERMFEKELSKYEQKITDKSLNEDNGKAMTVAEIDEDDNTEDAIAAGVMGNLQSNIVFILEGDNATAANTAVQAVTNEVQPEANPTINPEITNEVNPEIINSDSTTYAQAAEKAEASMTKSDKATTEAINTNSSDEVMARKPEIRTEDSQENRDTNSKSSENGNLSPLENENDKGKSIGQKEKTYEQTADAVKNALSENKPKTIISANEIAPPLSEGIKTEQFQATQQMTQATLNTPVKPENLFQEMINRVELMQNDTKSTMTIQLNPEFLGKVALEVAVDAAGLHVKINAEDSNVRSMINGQLTTLLESLENKGLAIAEVEVIYTGVNNGTFKEPGANEQQQESKHYKPAKRDVNAIDGIASYATLSDLQDYYFETGVSSVEFSA